MVCTSLLEETYDAAGTRHGHGFIHFFLCHILLLPAFCSFLHPDVLNIPALKLVARQKLT